MILSGHFSVAPNVHARRFDDELILLHLGVGAYFSLDVVGATVWEHLAEGRTGGDAVAAIVVEYEIDEVTARTDVEQLIRELLASGLLERTER